MIPLNISLQLAGNLSLRYEVVLLFIILWICKARLQFRRSDRVSQPNHAGYFNLLMRTE